MTVQVARESSALEARLEALAPGLDVLALAACVMDTQLRYRYLNAAYAADAGRDVSGFIGYTPDEIFQYKPSDSRRDNLRRALAGETVIFNRQTIEGPRAGRWVRAHYMPLRDGAQVIGVLVVLVDVQQLKDAEEALAQQRKQ